MATLFQNILNNAMRKGITNQRSRESIDWFRSAARKTSMSPSRLIREERANLVNSWTNVGVGQLYFFMYDPKWKKELPYYDKFPCIIPIERYKDGFLAINTHYLPPVLRAKLLDALYDTLTNEDFDEKTKMKINYGILKNASKFRLFKPCIKRYLGKHVRSRFIRVPPSQWTPAIFLPVESWEKANNQKVWRDSRNALK